MIDFLSRYFGLHHLFVVNIIFFLLVFIKSRRQLFNLQKIILILCFIDLISYNFYIFTYHKSNLIGLLPIHLCYFTEIIIFIKLFFKIRLDTNFIFLNSTVGSIAGLVNNNLTIDMHSMFFLHHYLAHSILALFVIEYYDKINLSFKNLVVSVSKTTVLLIFAFIFNSVFGTNYWFTNEKPQGNNLTLLFPDGPLYLIILIILGLLIYLALFFILKINTDKNSDCITCKTSH